MANKQILIVDDSEMNREILSDMIRNNYTPIEATNGKEALEILKNNTEIKLVLLDILMPEMNGLEVLEEMNNLNLISKIPIIMISSEDSYETIKKSYALGATDFIKRPFDMEIVLKRIENTLTLYTRQEILETIALEKIYDKNKNNELMIEILGNIVEFRNNESGAHVKNVKKYTEFLLRELMKVDNNKYDLNEEKIDLISTASALHDIGKISIPESILNKPGELTEDEFEIMKKHTIIGFEMLNNLEFGKDEPLVKYSMEITRYHHEKYDGKGYPDGLVGNNIPISAQVVSIADIFDALTSERVYKEAFSYEKTMSMLLNGECGNFNPDLISCLQKLTPEIVQKIKQESSDTTIMLERAKEMMNELLDQRIKNSF